MKPDFSKIRVIALSGEEFQRCEKMSAIVEVVLDPATKDFNYLELFPWDFKAEEFADFVLTYPLMAEKRIAVLRKFDTSSTKNESSPRKETGFSADQRKKVCEVLSDIPETTLVIIEGDKIAFSPKPDPAHLHEEFFKVMYDRDLARWIPERFQAKGKKVSPEGIHLMINNIGSGLRELGTEIEKICVAYPDKTSLTFEDMERIVGPLRRDKIWNLCHAVGLGDFREASEILDVLLEAEKNKESFFLLQIGKHIQKLSEFNSMIGRKVPRKQAIEAFDTEFKWKLNKMDQQAANLSPRESRRIISALVRTDSLLKKHGVDSTLILEVLLPFIIPGALRKKRA